MSRAAWRRAVARAQVACTRSHTALPGGPTACSRGCAAWPQQGCFRHQQRSAARASSAAAPHPPLVDSCSTPAPQRLPGPVHRAGGRLGPAGLPGIHRGERWRLGGCVDRAWLQGQGRGAAAQGARGCQWHQRRRGWLAKCQPNDRGPAGQHRAQPTASPCLPAPQVYAGLELLAVPAIPLCAGVLCACSAGRNGSVAAARSCGGRCNSARRCLAGGSFCLTPSLPAPSPALQHHDCGRHLRRGRRHRGGQRGGHAGVHRRVPHRAVSTRAELVARVGESVGARARRRAWGRAMREGGQELCTTPRSGWLDRVNADTRRICSRCIRLHCSHPLLSTVCLRARVQVRGARPRAPVRVNAPQVCGYRPRHRPRRPARRLPAAPVAAAAIGSLQLPLRWVPTVGASVPAALPALCGSSGRRLSPQAPCPARRLTALQA